MALNLFVAVLVGYGLTLFCNKLAGPRYFAVRRQSPVEPEDAIVFVEEYWPLGLLKCFFLFLGGLIYWSGSGIGGGQATLVMAIPCWMLGLTGVPDLFLRRKHTFMPERRKVTVKGFALFSGKSTYHFDYNQVHTTIERHFFKGRLVSHIMVVYPQWTISLGDAFDQAEAGAIRVQLIETLKLSDESASTSRTPVTPS
jgi:hypothetical protein